MSKKISISLVFQPDTKAAKAAIKDLSNSLTAVQNQANTKIMMGEQLTTELSAAATAANKLQAAMRAATDPATGQVNMVKMNATLKATGASMEQLRNALVQGGQAGVQAFVDLNNAILKAQAATRQTKTMVDKMWDTLGNTVRWQISAQAIQAVTSGLSQAFQYAKDLNTSLNNIRIVTGKSQETMEKFAKAANDSAKALSTTTTAYTDAALIYYQQGLSDKAVKERTDVTIKLANAVGESAQTVSEWMTAIWNNFDNGSKGLEYYADVIAALGASTASSADEIAMGLEKFAAVADTVGLSYEYATSALATVTAETRQSADVVGTAFKTLFARIQDLDLGKTLDDGTTLGEYSQALTSVGVTVKDTNGDLRAMDDILNDLGSRWDTLTKAQQVSVAQSVAGIRQYNQMIALMDNWETFQQNVTTAQAATGATDAYQETYAQSWEAAKKRVTASAEAIYDSLLNDEFFIELNNGLADLLQGFDKLIDAMGGLKGLLPLLIFGISEMFGPKIIASIQKFSYEMSMSGRVAAEELHKMQVETLKAAKEIANLSNATAAQRNVTEGLGKRLTVNTLIADLGQEGRLTPQAQAMIDTYNAELDTRAQQWVDAGTRMDQASRAQDIEASLRDRASEYGYTADDIARIAEHPENFATKDATEAQKAFIAEVKQANAELEKQGITLKKVSEATKEGTTAEGEAIGTKTRLISTTEAVETATDANNQAQKRYEQAIRTTEKALRGYKNSLDLAGNVNKMISGISSATFALSSLWSLIDTWNNTEMTGPEKLRQTLMSISIILPGIISAFTNLKKAKILETTTALLNAAVNKKEESKKVREKRKTAQADKEEAAASREAALANKQEAAASREAAMADRLTNGGSTQKVGKNQIKLKGQPIQYRHPDKGNDLGEKTYSFSSTSYSTDVGQKQIPSKGEVPPVKPGAALGKAALNFIKAFGPTIALAGAAIILGKTLYDLYNKTEKAFENAKKTTANLKKAYDETVTATNELKQSIDGFKEKQNALDGLVKGTVEYKEALIAANEEARKLIQEGDLVAGQDYHIVNGQIEIEEAALDRAYENQLLKQQNAANAVATAQIDQNQKQLANEQLEAARKLNIQDNAEQAGWGVGVGATAALAAAAIATIFTGGLAAPLLAAAGAAVVAGTAGGLLLGGESDKEVALLEKLQEDSENNEFLTNKEDFEAYLQSNKEVLDITEQEIQELVNNRESIQDLIESNKELEASNRLLYQQRGQGVADRLVSEGKITEDEANIMGGSIGAFLQADEKNKRNQWNQFTEDLDDADLMLNNLAKELEIDGHTEAGDHAILDDQKITQVDFTNRLVAELQNLYYSDPERFNDVLKSVQGHQNSLETVFLRYFTQMEQKINYDDIIATDKQRIKNLEAYGITDNEDLYNILESKRRGEEFDLGSIFTWDDYASFKNKNRNVLDDMSGDMRKALANFEEEKKKITIRNNKNYDEDSVESNELQGVLSDLGMTQAQADAYGEALKTAYSLSEEFADHLAGTNLHFKDYIASAGKVYTEYSGIFKKGDKTSIEYSKGIGEMTKVMSHLFVGLGEDAEFTAQHIDLIMQALEGEEGKLEELQRAAALRSAQLVDTTDDVRKQLTSIIESIPTDIKIGASLSSTDIDISALNQSLEAGKANITQIRNALETAGWEVITTTADDGIEIIDKFLTKWVGLGTENWLQGLNLNDKEIERYHEVDEILDTISKKLGQIEKIKERTFGKAHDDAFNLQLQEQQNNIDALKRKLGEAQNWLSKDASALAGYGFKFDADGHISNYDEILEGLEGTKRQEAEKLIGNFETARDLVQQLGYDIQNEEYILNVSIPLERIQDNIDFQVEVKGETELTKLNFLLQKTEDNAYAAAEAIGLMGEQVGVYSNNFSVNWKNMEELLTLKGASAEAIKKFQNGDVSGILGLELYPDDFNALRQYQENMISNYESMKEAFDGIFEAMDSVFEKINEEFDELDAVLEHSQSVLKSYQNIIELTGASTLGISDAMQLDIMDSQLDVANTLIKNNKAQYDKNVEMLAEARQGLADAEKTGDETLIRKWKESIETYEEEVRQSEQDWLSALENGLELSNQRREQAINLAIKNFLKETTGYGSMDELQQIYDQQKQLRDLYVSDYEKAYSLSKLSRQLDKSINEISNVNAKKQLLDLEKRINKAKEAGVKLSTYELSNLEREYQIELAKIALEEAQNAKSTVRLRRNSEGGMSYVYTADQNALDQAQQKYEDAIYASEKANDEWLNSAEEGMLQVTKTYIEQMTQITTAAELSEEERQEAIDRLNNWYIQQQKFYTGQIDTVLENNNTLYSKHIATMGNYYKDNETNFKTMCDNMVTQGTGFNNDFRKTFLAQLSEGLLGEADSASAYFKDLVVAIGDSKTGFLGTITAAQYQWVLDTQDHFEAAGGSIEQFKNDVNRYLNGENGVKKSIDYVNESLENLQKKTDFTAAKTAAENYGKDVAQQMALAYTQITNVNTALQTLIDTWTGENGLTSLPDLNLGDKLGLGSNQGNKGEADFDADEGKVTHSPKSGFVGAYGTGGAYGVHVNTEGKIIDSELRKDGQYWYKLDTAPQQWIPEALLQQSSNKFKISEVVMDQNGNIFSIADMKYNAKIGYSYFDATKNKWHLEKDLLKGLKFDTSSTTVDLRSWDPIKNLFVHISSQKNVTGQIDGRYYDANGYEYLRVGAGSDYTGLWIDKESLLMATNLSEDLLKRLPILENPITAPYAFDTGGYTGEWGPEGRLAMLHQKEIVLNAHDTENILTIVDMVRQMATQLDFNALTMARGLGNLVANTMITTPQTIDQNVTITAEFPNATNREEIKEAFGDLVNLAAQYANRK